MFRALIVTVVLMATIVFAGDMATSTFGKTPTLTETTAISKLNQAPTDLVNHDVMLTGRIVDICQHMGCWMLVEGPDSSRILCKSLDETILLPKDALGKTVQVQGKLKLDTKAPGSEMKAEKGEAAHACPAPKVLVATEGAVLSLVSLGTAASPIAPETHRIDAPKEETKPETPKAETPGK